MPSPENAYSPAIGKSPNTQTRLICRPSRARARAIRIFYGNSTVLSARASICVRMIFAGTPQLILTQCFQF